MKLSDFDEEIDEKIVDRGLRYYKEGRVLDLDQLDEGKYMATVEGTEDYQVMIQLSGKGEILEHFCDCPYDWGEYCKHEAATLFALREYADGGKPPAKAPQKANFRQVLHDMPREELEAIVLELAERDSSLRQRIVLSYGQAAPTDADIRRMILNGLRRYGRNGYVDYEDTAAALEAVDDALEIGRRQRDPADTARIALVTLETVTDVAEMVDDSDGNIYDLLIGSVGLFQEAAERAKDAERQQRIFDMGLGAAGNKAIWDEQRMEVLGLLLPLADSGEKQRALEASLEAMEGAESDSGDWSRERAAFLRMQLLEQRDPAAARRFLDDHIALSSFQKYAIEKAMEAGDYRRAADLAQAGVRADKGMPGLVKKWLKFLADAAQAAGDSRLERESLRKLCIDGDMEDYKRLKAACPAEEWGQVREKILAEMEGKPWLPSVYPKILEVEGLHAKLMAYCEKLPHTISQYSGILAKPYPERTDALFLRVLREAARAAGDRNMYQGVCASIRRYAKAMGKERALAFAGELRENYPRRRAFMDELNKLSKALEKGK